MHLLKTCTPYAECEIKFDASKVGVFEGYASVFGGRDSYDDTIENGAYAETLKNRRYKPAMFFSHNPSRPIGKWLDLREDDRGLFVAGSLTLGSTDGKNTYELMKDEAMSGLSIGFLRPKEGEFEMRGDLRVLKKINLVEISPVTMPADDDARVSGVKSAIDSISKLSDVEDVLREAGLSKSEAVALVAAAFRCKAVTQGEPAEVAELKRQVSETSAQLLQVRTELLLAKYPIPSFT